MGYIILRTFAFAGVKHPELSPLLRRAPLAVAALFTLVFLTVPVRPPLTGDGSIGRHMTTVFTLLPGFFIVALAAVATFNRSGMDEIMPDPAPELKLRTGGDESYVPVTFRMFTTHLFSYLTSLLYCIVYVCGRGSIFAICFVCDRLGARSTLAGLPH